MTEKLLVDTNVIIHFPSVVTTLGNVHIHLKTVEELDRLKESENPELAYRARKGAKLIEHNLDKIIIERGSANGRKKTVDTILLQCAKKKNYTLITNDLTLRLRCRFSGVKTQPYTNGDKTIFTGTERISLSSQDDILEFISNVENFKHLNQNQFLIIETREETFKSHDGKIEHTSHAQFIRKGDELIEVKDQIVKNGFYSKVMARNVEQKCLLHALFDDNIKILTVTGGFGTGKLKCSLVE